MHIRVRNQTAQLIRTQYDQDTKKGRNIILGSVKLVKPELPAELKKELTVDEIATFDTWRTTHLQARALRRQLTALTLAENMAEAGLWLASHKDDDAARPIATAIMQEWQSLRKILNTNGLLD